MKESYYFSHDNNARNDLKVKAMISKYGYEGYGMFWALVEMMHESGQGELPLEEYLYIAVEREFNGSSTDVQQYINDCINVFKLFETDGEHFWSNSLKRRMEIREKKREQASKAGKKSAEIRQQQTVVEQQLNVSSTESNKGKGRKEKGKENKKDIYTPDFETFYNTYPNSANKMQTFNNWKALIKTNNPKEIIRTAERYAKEVQGKDKQFVVVSSNFIGKKAVYLDYLDDTYKEPQPKGDGRVGMLPCDSDLGPREEVWM